LKRATRAEATIPVMLLAKNDVNLAMTVVAIEAHVAAVVTEADVAEIVVAEVETTVVVTVDLVENDVTSTMTVVDQARIAQSVQNDPIVMTRVAETEDQGVQQVGTMAVTVDQVHLAVDRHSQ
jgi:hypothetical protein